jgi:hypothetical protein
MKRNNLHMFAVLVLALAPLNFADEDLQAGGQAVAEDDTIAATESDNAEQADGDEIDQPGGQSADGSRDDGE